jgi:NAD(P)-dependent dehydrogenase (short-subunit alcohol dehydrogenase family)
MSNRVPLRSSPSNERETAGGAENPTHRRIVETRCTLMRDDHDAPRKRPDEPIEQPIPPYPEQRQRPPGLESELDPAPRWRGDRYRSADKLAGMAALITGGDSGIGRSVAYLFAREGADVAITALPEEASDAAVTQEAIAELGRRCIVLEGDLAEAEHCDHVVEATERAFGRLDVLVHNAAWQNRKRITELSEDELDRTMKVNVYAYLRLARAAVPRMGPGSSIIATGSVAGVRGSDRMSDYAATKGAIHSITRSLAQELVDAQIRVNTVAPGPVWTPLNPADTGLAPDEVATFGYKNSSTRIDRPGQPEEIAPAFVFLASNADSSFVNGSMIVITGGPI